MKELIDDEEELKHAVDLLTPKDRNRLRDQLSRYKDPEGEDSLKGPYDGPAGEVLSK